ncbi:hypothetical protein [Xanthomonas perforans]|uniref:non-homologous end-joining DNA ligase LigD n=1 Tax=Xanthomonas perforans TaxID=442694 RepID=UPI003CCFD454
MTSGSKGIHLYARLDKAVSSEGASALAKQIAQSLAKQTPDLVTATMKRSIRDGKVFVDWSQNSGAKTTVAPYSLRGRAVSRGPRWSWRRCSGSSPQTLCRRG